LLVWEEPDATPTVDLRPLNGSVGTLIFSADGSLLAIGYSDGEVLVAAATAPLPPRSRRFEYRGRVESIAFTATGRLISSAGDGIIRLCRFDADETSILLRIHGTRTNTVIAPDGRWLAAADAERTVQLWRLHTDTKTPGGSFWRVLRGMQGRPTLLRISANANTIAVYSDDGTIRVWHTNDLERDQEQPVFTVTGPIGRIRSLALADNGERLAAGSDEGKIAIWELSNEQPITILPTQERAISALAFTPDGRGIAAGTSDGRCFIWRIPRRHTRQRSNAGPTILHGHAGSITRLAYSPSDALLASGSSDGTVRLWRIDDGAKTTRR
jgi:WD40 repeat protein